MKDKQNEEGKVYLGIHKLLQTHKPSGNANIFHSVTSDVCYARRRSALRPAMSFRECCANSAAINSASVFGTNV